MYYDIKEASQNISMPISFDKLENIINQMKNCICRIKSIEEGTGFFCLIPFPDKFNLLHVLMTNYHVLNINDIDKDKEIQLSINNDNSTIKIKIDNTRKTYTNKEYDITIIEIKESDGININSFLEIDDKIFNSNNYYNNYRNLSIYLIYYIPGEKSLYSKGIIKKIAENKYTIEHLCPSAKGSSGCPIINFNNSRVIGIHKGSSPFINSCKLGTFLKEPIEKFYQENKENEKIFLRKSNNKKENEKLYQNKDNKNLKETLEPLEYYQNTELEESYPLGLDLGNNFSCIGVFRNGGVEILPNSNGDRITPSIVTILDEQTILKGEETLDHLVKDYDSSIYGIKRFIGRNFKDPHIKNEIENFPFNIIENNNNLYIEVKIKEKKMKFSLEEISSFIIRKMVDNAKKYLNRKINKLVITVPAYFNDSQRNSTKQAAYLAGCEVIRIINEPTAAALAYHLQEKKIGDNILVFDFGGRGLNITILKIVKTNGDIEHDFEILSTCGNRFLGGEDFDNKLAEYVLNDFCQKYELSKEIIKKDKKVIKRLKMACENIKIILNDREETTLYINNFYNNKDIIQRISRNNFEILCEYLFQKINESLNNALRDAKLKNEEIKEIVFVGGSTRIPRIKYILTDYFINAKINESINPDEIVAYGATLMAKNILLKKDSLSYFNFMDIVPFSLGINIKNNSLNPDIQKEGDLMDVIIKRGSLIPIQNVKEYFIIYDNQISIKIYEGEKKYVKYNHLLKEINLNGLSENLKKEVKIKVIFEIGIDGILTIKIKEENKKDIFIDCVIKIDEVKLSNEEIEKLKEKNKKYMEKCKRKMNIDYKNIKETLRDVQNILNETKDEEDKFNILMCLNNILEEFIDNLEKDFDSLDNEIQLEKYYLYIKELFNSINKVFKLKEYLDIGKKNKIMDNIKKYLNLFIKLNVGYLDDLLEIIKDLPIFYEIILFAMEKLNQCGKNCLKEMKKLCKYNSLKYFEKSKTLFSKYNIDRNKFLFIKLYKNYKIQMQICEEYIDDINSSLILLFEDNIKFDELILSETGFSGKSILEDKNEGYQSLKEYEKMLPKYEGKGNIKEAFILFKIITINYKLLGKKSFDMYKMGERIEFILKKINPKPKWYKEFNEIFTELEESLKIKENDREKIKRKYKTIFEEIDKIFKERKNNREFIKYILQKYPYKGYEKDKNNRKFNNITAETLFYLRTKYCPDKYSFNFEDEDS